MNIKWTNLNKTAQTIIHQVAMVADKNSLWVYLVGGVVRDILLKKKNLDLDFVVEGDAMVLARALARRLKAKITVYEKFKTATLKLPRGVKFDLATARKESYAYPGALPDVQSGTLTDDLFRRDFTMNAVAVCINDGQIGEIVDLYGGLNDLKKGQIRILHPKSFIDDPTRILRAVRFEQRFQFNIEKDTLSLLKQALQENRVDSVKPQRYFEEFKKILAESQPLLCLKRLSSLKALDFILKGYQLNGATEKLFKAIEKNLLWFSRRFPSKEKPEAGLVYLMGLLQRVPFDVVSGLLERFNLSREDREAIFLSKMKNRVLKSLSKEKIRPYQVYRILKPLSDEAILFLRSQEISAKVRGRIDKYLLRDESVALSVTGKDLQKLGIPQGRLLGVILEEILHQKINGKIKSRRNALRFARKIKEIKEVKE